MKQVQAWKDWNPRYIAYARAHGRTPEEMLADDSRRFPGGIAGGFLRWIDQQWSRWAQETGRGDLQRLTPEDHRRFDAWLTGGRRGS